MNDECCSSWPLARPGQEEGSQPFSWPTVRNQLRAILARALGDQVQFDLIGPRAITLGPMLHVFGCECTRVQICNELGLGPFRIDQGQRASFFPGETRGFTMEKGSKLPRDFFSTPSSMSRAREFKVQEHLELGSYRF